VHILLHVNGDRLDSNNDRLLHPGAIIRIFQTKVDQVVLKLVFFVGLSDRFVKPYLI
jgi:hypothetical protein